MIHVPRALEEGGWAPGPSSELGNKAGAQRLRPGQPQGPWEVGMSHGDSWSANVCRERAGPSLLFCCSHASSSPWGKSRGQDVSQGLAVAPHPPLLQKGVSWLPSGPRFAHELKWGNYPGSNFQAGWNGVPAGLTCLCTSQALLLIQPHPAGALGG